MPDYTATDFYKDELNRLEAKKQSADSIINSHDRLAKLNDSYRKRYSKYVQILMVLILAYVIYLAVVMLQKMFPIIPQLLVDTITVVLIFLVAMYLFSASWELYSRSVSNYDELDLPTYDSSGIDVSKLVKKGQIFDFQSEKTRGNVCVGRECCPNFYNDETNTCNLLSSFTTLEYENVDNAYTVVPFDSPTLKREANIENIKPYSKAILSKNM